MREKRKRCRRMKSFEIDDAINMFEQAIEQQDTDFPNECRQFVGWLKELKWWRENDAISRQKAIEALDKDIMGGLNYKSILNRLPSAEPERKKGQWVFVHPLQSDDPGAYMCSECKMGMWEIIPSVYHYCPNCGCQMEEGGE